jgi:PAS domain S-box-containing protein
MAPEDFKRIVESIRIPVAVADPQGSIVFGNETFAQLVGRTPRELPGVSLGSLFADTDRKRVLQNCARIAEGKTSSSLLEARIASKDGEGRWVQATLSPARDERDQASGVVVALQDIEATRETENTLNLFAARLFAIADASSIAAMIENASGEIELVTEAFCHFLGTDSAPQSLMGLPARDVLARSKRKKKEFKRQTIVVDEGDAGALWIPAETAAAAAPTDKTASEISLIEKIGEELSVALEGISAITIRAQEMEFDPVLIEHFARIRASTETAVAAIGDLVDFSNVSGGVILNKREFGLRAALADLVKRVAAEAEERGCRLRIRVEQDVSDQLEGDVERLQLLLKNLLDNTFQLVSGTEITLHITPEYVTESGIQLSFGVSSAQDDGDKPVPRFSPESGMGVAVAKFMVTAMGGKLAISSRPGGEIYSFTIEFPVLPAPAPPRRATFASVVGLGVLVVSADPEQRLLLSNVLRGWRMVPLEADNPEMAIKLLERMHEENMPVGLVIVSDQLPGQDGFMLAFRVKHHRRLGATILMLLATRGKPGDAIACRENGISAYMRYPINDRQLNEAIMAVTGASVDADETPTLVTRHSLREQRKGATLLLVDANRDSQILVSHILAKRDCNVVSAQDLEEALAAVEQDFYDLVLVDPVVKGLEGADGVAKLRDAIQRDADKVHFVACSVEHSPAWSEARKAEGYNATLAKPFNKDHLLQTLAAIGKLPEEQ